MGLLDSIASSLSGTQGSASPDSSAPQGGDISQLTQPSGGQIPQSGANNATMNPQPQQQQQPQGQQQMGPQLHGIKGYLSNIFYNMGEAAKAHLGMKTDTEVQLEQQKINIQKQQADATTFEKNSEAQWRQQQTAANAPGPIVDQQESDALGVPLGTMISPAQKFALYKEKVAGLNKANVAQIGANARLGAAQIQALSRMSQTTMKAAYMPDGSLGVGLYDKAGNFKGYADNAVVPAGYLEKIHHGQEFKVDADGTLQSIPTTSTSTPLVPPPSKPNQLVQSPEAPNPANLKGILTKGAEQAGQVASGASPVTPAGAKAALQNGAAKGGAQPVTNAKPVMAGGKPFQAPSAADTVYATDPKSGETIFTSRSDAAVQGLTNVQKVNPAQSRKDQALVGNMADIQRKVGDYQDTFNTPLSSSDKLGIAYLNDNNIGGGLSAGGVHVNIIPSYVQDRLKAAGMASLSPEALARYTLYRQAEESLTALQQAKTGSNRGSDKVLQLHIEQLAPPGADEESAKYIMDQFQQNIDYASQSLPKFPGIQNTQQSVKAVQVARRQQNQAVTNNQNNPQAYIDKNKTGEPARPANVPQGYVFQQNGPKGAGWYKPKP